MGMHSCELIVLVLYSLCSKSYVSLAFQIQICYYVSRYYIHLVAIGA
uniref:Uncharacterized protein n=1 Tax=Setaria viridis TaxID=4556 RepID=A0A4V6D4B9_SETVI|nr:hypothetical protein SEVIR_7G212650v2 [Setaria viridis]